MAHAWQRQAAEPVIMHPGDAGVEQPGGAEAVHCIS